MRPPQHLAVHPCPAPALALLPYQGALRPLDSRLLEYLGLSELPPAGSLAELLEAAGFHSLGGDIWEREECLLRVGENWLEDGARLVWVLPANGELEARQQRGRYLTLASHDLRGALANVRSYTELLLRGRVPLDPKVRQRLEALLRNVDRALAFAQDFFDASRADLGLLAIEHERLRLEPLLSRAVERQQVAAQQAEVVLVLEAPGPLPEVEGDAGRVQHALEAFLRHHLTRAQPGEQIRLRAGAAGSGGVRVEVRRLGTPVADEELPTLFSREERAFRERKLEDALRLSLARQEVEALGGTVGVVADALGTTLYLTLPATLSPSASLQP